jgi:tRNA threonylcarbamoyladenosine biosynthesis protein TsaB
MNNILALDTSTDACSASLRLGGLVEAKYRLLPRKHNHLLFEMIEELVPGGGLASIGLDLLAYGHGPGSFTGLRIAASAVQGLAYTLGLPVAGVSTLACLAQGALRRGAVFPSDTLLVMIDARINEVYWGVYRFEDGLARPLGEDRVSAPGDLPENLLTGAERAVALGSGLCHFDQLPAALRASVHERFQDQWPDSRDLIPLADDLQGRQRLVDATSVQPVYLRNEIHWKKLSEQ